MATRNVTDSNWIPYGHNDSLSAVVFTTGSDVMDYSGTDSTELFAATVAGENSTTLEDLPSQSPSWNTSSSPDYYGWNLTGYDASLNNVFPENGSWNGNDRVAFFNVAAAYDDIGTGNWSSMVPTLHVSNVTTTSDNGTFAAAFADGDVWSKVVKGAYNDTDLVVSTATGMNMNMSVTGTMSSADVGISVGGGGGDEEYLYPSGHSVTTIAIAAIIVTFIMIMVVVGNMLVIVAISTEKNLKTIQNWFIASLAVADFFIGLVVMPFSLAKELMGYWIFGTWWCEIHLALDVMLCTSSILNLCLISLDRYWSITQAVDYLKKRTASRAAVMITIVWALAFLISVPPLVSWNKMSEPQGEIPICEVSKDTLYVVYSASGSFFIPSVIMVFVYVQIYFAARSRARRVVKRHRPTLDPTKDKSTTTTSFSNASPPDKVKNAPNTPSTPRCGEMPTIGEGGLDLQPPPHQQQQQQLLVPPASTPSANVSFISGGTGMFVTPCVKRDGVVSFQEDRTTTTTTTTTRSSTPVGNNNSSNGGNEKHRMQVQLTSPTPASTPTSSPLQRANTVGSCSGSHLGSRMFGMVLTSAAGDQRQVKANGTSSRSFKIKASPSRLVSQAHALAQAQAQILLSDDMECLSELDHSSDSDQLPNRDGNNKPVLSGFRRLTLLCNPSSKKAATATNSRSNVAMTVSAASSQQHEQEIDLMVRVVVPPKPRDPEREKRRIARKKERRATLILGLIMAAFILCWLPFFTLYMVRAVCASCSIDDIVFSFAFWLGYCNSVLNPVIYTIFNKDFRKAFRKILFK